MVAGVYFWGLTGALAASICSNLFACAISGVVMRSECRRWRIPLNFDGWSIELPLIWKFAIPVFLSSIWFMPLEWAMNAILVHQQDGYAQLGLFSAAKQWFVIMLYLPNIVSGLTFPMLSNLWAEDRLKCRRFMVMNTWILLALTLLLAGPVAIFAGQAMRIWGKDFSSGTWVLLVLCARALTTPPNIVVGQAIWAMGSTKAGIFFSLFRGAFLLLIYLCLLQFGALGMAGAFATSDLLLMLVQIIFLRKQLNGIKSALCVF
jgi:O-antigen/teichoic acid export membrane protein